MKTLLRLTIVLMAMTVIAGSAQADEFYYILIFGSQTSPRRAKYTHTWATFVRAVGQGPDANTYQVEAHTISWLPQTLDVKVLRLSPETGVNLPLEQTIATTLSHGETIDVWGPFRITPQMYQSSLEVKRLFESGVMQYQAVPLFYDPRVNDCIQAVVKVDSTLGGPIDPIFRFGKPESRYIARRLRTQTEFGRIGEDHPWLVDRLGLHRPGITIIPPSTIPPVPCGLCIRPD